MVNTSAESLPELESALKAYTPCSASEPDETLVLARDVLAELELGSSLR